jgi:hypothetical protein
VLTICYLTNKDLGHRRFYFTSHGTCVFFFFFFSCCGVVVLFYFDFFCLLVSRSFVCYLTNEDLGLGGSILLDMVHFLFIFPSCLLFIYLFVPLRSCVLAFAPAAQQSAYAHLPPTHARP